jgi:hypothetical protein
MSVKIKSIPPGFFRKNENQFNRKYYAIFGHTVLINRPIVSTLRTFIYNMGFVLLLLLAVIVIFIKIKKKYRPDEEAANIEMESWEIKNMLSYRYKSRIIVTIEGINEESISALSYAKALSNDITAFCICSDEESCKNIKEDFSLLDTDIKLATKYSAGLNATEQLLEFIESTEFNFTQEDIITIILPRFATQKSWRIFHGSYTKLYMEEELKRYENVIVITLPTKIED